MSEEGGGAGGESVRALLEHDDQVVDVGVRQRHVVGQQVEWRAEASDDRHDIVVLRIGRAIADDDRVVAADRLAEVARRGQLVVHAAVDDDERLAARDLAIDDPRDVDPALPHEEAPQLDDGARLGESRGDRPIDEFRQPFGDSAQIQRLVAGGVRDAETAAEVQQRHLTAREQVGVGFDQAGGRSGKTR